MYSVGSSHLEVRPFILITIIKLLSERAIYLNQTGGNTFSDPSMFMGNASPQPSEIISDRNRRT